MSTDDAPQTPTSDSERAAAEVTRTSALDGEIVAPVRIGDPASIEAEIARRREHLAATVDELVERTRPKALARQGVEEAKSRLRAATLTPEGELRTERLGAVAAAIAVFVVLSVVLRRRRRRRLGSAVG